MAYRFALTEAFVGVNPTSVGEIVWIWRWSRIDRCGAKEALVQVLGFGTSGKARKTTGPLLIRDYIDAFSEYKIISSWKPGWSSMYDHGTIK
ncbi:similar to An13g00540 [Aspergillus luchuensis]|uniref:Similar to An13g00540 n=1 Tax=Aspergillus kawachii TaxID=1069201 RepID=A0A146FDV3_ASPKA|nr:similar to An13g00540 [Aspergillus luchuensis]